MNDFWMTIATVIPVLALGAVLEMRGTKIDWYQLPGWVRSVTTLTWALFLLNSSVAEGIAIRALNPNWSMPPGWAADYAMWVIQAGLGLLILGPGVELLIRAMLPTYALLRSIKPGLRFKAARNYFRIRWMQRRATRIEGRAMAHAAVIQAGLTQERRVVAEQREVLRATQAKLGDAAPGTDRHGMLEQYAADLEAWIIQRQQSLDDLQELLDNPPESTLPELERMREDAVQAWKKISSTTAELRHAHDMFTQDLVRPLNPVLPPPPPPPQRPGDALRRQDPE